MLYTNVVSRVVLIPSTRQPNQRKGHGASLQKFEGYGLKGQKPTFSWHFPNTALATLDNNCLRGVKMISEDAKKQKVYEQILKVASGRLEQAIPGSEGAFTHLPLGAV